MGRHRARSSPQGPRHSHGRQRWHVSGRTFFPILAKGRDRAWTRIPQLLLQCCPHFRAHGACTLYEDICRNCAGEENRINQCQLDLYADATSAATCAPTGCAGGASPRAPPQPRICARAHAQQTTIFRFSRLAHHANSDLRSPHARTTGATTCLKMTTIFYFSRLPLQRNMQTRDIG